MNQSSQFSLRNYFLANQNIPWPAIMLSIVAAETSTLTLVSIPGLAYDTNLGFLQLVFGYIIARLVISLIFLPQYFRGRMFTAYELIQYRFGKQLRVFTAILFLLTRAAAEGVRILAIAIVLGVTLGSNDIISLAIVVLITLGYTMVRGMPVVIWTDVAQVGIYLTGALVAFFTLCQQTPGGWSEIYTAAQAAHKLQIFDFSRNFFITYTFWSGLLGGLFLTLASHGTDQLIVQRLLSAKNLRSAQIALIASGFIILLQFTLFLIIGVMLWNFYRDFPPAAAFVRADKIFPIYIAKHLANGPFILLVMAIVAAAMANLSAALNSLASSSVMDIYLLARPQASEKERLRIARFATIFWGLVLFTLAIFSRHGGRVLEMGLAIASVTYGSMLGVFLLGTLTQRANQHGALLGMLSGLVLNIYLWRYTHVPYTWYVLLGSITTGTLGYLASRALGPDEVLARSAES